MIALIGLHFWPDTYKSETLILVDSQKIPEQFVNSTVSTELQDRLATLSQQILSNTRLQKIIDTFHLYENQRARHTREEILDMMRSDINITLEKGWAKDRPGAFRVAYHAPTAQMAADVANQLGSLFVEENLRAREVQAEGTSDFFKSQLAEAKKTLDELEAKVSKYKLQHNGQLPQQEPTLNSTLTRLQIELEGNQDAINRAEQQRTMLENAVSVAEGSESSLKRTIAQTNGRKSDGSRVLSSVSEIQHDREEVESRLGQLRLKYREEHPDIQNLKAQLEYFKRLEAKATERNAAELKARSKDSQETQETVDAIPPEFQRALSQERERVSMLRSQLAVARKEVDRRKEERQQILARIGSYQTRLESLPIREQELAGVTRDYEISKVHYMSLLNKIHAVDMAADMERRQKAERFNVLDPARVPEKPVAPNRPLFGAGACLLSLALSAGILLGLELRKNVIIGEWELPASVQILGRVPLSVAGAPAPRRHHKHLRRAESTATVLIAMVVFGLRMWIKG